MAIGPSPSMARPAAPTCSLPEHLVTLVESNLRGVGVARGILGAHETQENAQYLILRAKRSIRVAAFTWDRKDLTVALAHAHGKGVSVRVGVGRGQTASGTTRDQAARLGELHEAGVGVVLLE
eukprot:3985679-Alexandrium_andersonii.AAC.1